MIGALVNLYIALVWVFLVGVDVLTWSEIAPALVISGIGFLGCVLMELSS